MSSSEKQEQGRVIRRFYNLTRPVTETERVDTIKMLERKRDTDQLDSRTIHLAAQLRVI